MTANRAPAHGWATATGACARKEARLEKGLPATTTPQGNSQPRVSRCAAGSPEHSTPASAPAASPTACLSTQIARASWTAVAATEAASITTRAGQSESW